MCQWQEQVAQAVTGRRTLDVIQPLLREWVERGWGGISFYAAQVLTGHGCFDGFLCRIGKERTERCHNCGWD